MQYSISQRGSYTVIELEDRIDSSNSAEFNTLLMDLIGQGTTKIVLEMSRLLYMSSAGLRVIIAAMKELRDVSGSLKLAALSEHVLTVFQLVGLGLFEIYESVDLAVGKH